MNSKLLYWSSRLLAIAIIFFIMMFSLDCFEGTWKWKEQLICFAMHNIPSVVLITTLILAWRHELAGGILFILMTIAGSIIFKAYSTNPGVWILLLPLLITGILFMLQDEILIRKFRRKNG